MKKYELRNHNRNRKNRSHYTASIFHAAASWQERFPNSFLLVLLLQRKELRNNIDRSWKQAARLDESEQIPDKFFEQNSLPSP